MHILNIKSSALDYRIIKLLRRQFIRYIYG